jgi:hypothetical protein
MTYQDRLDDRRDRLEAAAAKAEAETDRRFKAATEGLPPMGQPILVGHHSEKRHRAAIKRSDVNMRKGSEAHDRAKDLRYRAAAVGTGGISADDEDAPAKIADRIAELTARQEKMKSRNAYWRKNATMVGCPGVSDAKAKLLDEDIPGRYSWARKPYPSYALSNNNANIRRLKLRLEVIEEETARREEPTPEPDRQDGFTFTEHPEENRAWIEFDRRPNKAVTKHLRMYGWKWSPTRTAWVRQLNDAARNSWKYYLAPEIPKLLEG